MPHRCNILELHRAINEQKEKKLQCFERVLDMCHKKMKAVSSKKMALFHVFKIPEFVVGYPLFCVAACMEFIVTSLKRDGFHTECESRNSIYVSWDWDEINSHKAIQQTGAKRVNMIDYKPSGKLLMNLN